MDKDDYFVFLPTVDVEWKNENVVFNSEPRKLQTTATGRKNKI